MIAESTMRRKSGSANGRWYILVFILSSLVIQASLFRIGGSRINYPLTVAGYALLLPYAVFNLTRGKASLPKSTLAFFLLYLAICFTSTIWSVDKTSTLTNATLLLIAFVVAAGGARYDIEDTIFTLLIASSFVMILSWLALLITPAYALQEKGFWRLRGVMSHEFELGYFAASSFILSAAYLIRGRSQLSSKRRLMLVPILLLSVVTLYATQTRTLLAYAALCIVLVSIVHSRGYMRLLAFGGSIAVVASAIALSGAISERFSRNESDASLSGRTLIWERTIAESANRPWTGHGYASFASPQYDHIWRGDYRPPHAHNTWVMSYFEVGLIGAIAVTAFLFSQLWTTFRNYRTMNGRGLVFFVTLYCTMAGMTSLVYGGKLSPVMAIILLMCCQEFNKAASSR